MSKKRTKAEKAAAVAAETKEKPKRAYPKEVEVLKTDIERITKANIKKEMQCMKCEHCKIFGGIKSAILQTYLNKGEVGSYDMATGIFTVTKEKKVK